MQTENPTKGGDRTQRLIRKQEAWQKIWGMTAAPRALREIEILETAIQAQKI